MKNNIRKLLLIRKWYREKDDDWHMLKSRFYLKISLLILVLFILSLDELLSLKRSWHFDDFASSKDAWWRKKNSSTSRSHFRFSSVSSLCFCLLSATQISKRCLNFWRWVREFENRDKQYDAVEDRESQHLLRDLFAVSTSNVCIKFAMYV